MPEHTHGWAAVKARGHTLRGPVVAMPRRCHLPRSTAPSAEGYPLDLREVLADAARHLRGSKRVIVGGGLAWLAISLVVGWITLALGLGSAPSGALGVLATAPLTVGLVMVGARRAAGLAVTPADLWAYRGVTAHAAIVMLANLLVVVGSEALFGPIASLPRDVAYGLFTCLRCTWSPTAASPAARDRRLDACWCGTAGRACCCCSCCSPRCWRSRPLTLGVALIWTGPYAVIALGAVYVRAVGLASARA